jgi:rhodanese-related sulfurtransferase
MPTEIGRDRIPKLMESGARLVEVLSSDEYKEEHIAGAINIPLGKLDRDNATQAGLDHARPVIVYCQDSQ